MDLYSLLRAIDSSGLDDAILYVEGTSIASEVVEVLDKYSVEPTTRVARGTALPRPETFHVPLSTPAVRELREVAKRHAEPEICDHLVVYRAERVLVSAYDAGSIDVLLAVDLEPEVVERFRPAAGA